MLLNNNELDLFGCIFSITIINQGLFSRYFKKRFWSSFWVFALLIGALWLVRNKQYIIPHLENILGQEWKESSESVSNLVNELLPNHNFKDESISRAAYMVSFDQKSLQPRFTIHLLADTMTRGSASRYGLRINDSERIYSHTAKYSDYSYSGFDRGHMVPAGDFSCCQNLLEDTFMMSNIAAFDSVLNRHAWQELESYTRRMARKYVELVVITGTVFENNRSIGRSNRIQVPSHFYKILVRHNTANKAPKAVVAFLLANRPIYSFSKAKHQTSVDEIEKLTGLDYFYTLEKTIQANFEDRLGVGKW